MSSVVHECNTLSRKLNYILCRLVRGLFIYIVQILDEHNKIYRPGNQTS